MVYKKVQLGLICLAYAFILLSDVFNDTVDNNLVLDFLDIGSIALLSFSFALSLIVNRKRIREHYDKKYLWIVLLGVVSIISALLIVQNRPLLKLSFMLLVIQEIDFRRFIKIDLKMKLTLVGIMLLLCLTGAISNSLLEVRNGLPRYTFGFSHPNNFADWIFAILADLFYIVATRRPKKKIEPFPIALAGLYLIFDFFFVGSRTVELLTVLLVVGYVFAMRREVKRRFLRLFIMQAFLIFAVVSFVLAYFYNQDAGLFTGLDKALSKRVSLSHWYLMTYPLTAFGTAFGPSIYTLDNSFLSMLLRFGIVFFVIFAIAFRNTMKKMIERKETMPIIILLLYLVHGLSQTVLYVVAKSPMILLLGAPSLKERTDDRNT